MKLIFKIFILFAVFALALTSLSRDKIVHAPDYYEVSVNKLYEEGNYEGAFELLEEGLRAYPNATHLNEFMGKYYIYKKDFNKARYYLYRAIREDNSNVDAKQMLVTVEESTKNYSSAICYINELLEVNPYWKGLWVKKMNIFRNQGNNIEADRILKRLVEIYPEDAQLRRRLMGHWEENLTKYHKNGNSREAIESLRQMILSDPKSMENYVLLCNYLLQNGLRDEALAVVSQGLGIQPTYLPLAEKRVGILSEQHRYSEAIDYIKSYQRMGGSGLSTSLNYLEEEAARDAVSKDPYIMYGKIYGRSKSSEALNFLLSTSVARGYTSDALFYIGEAKKRQGETPQLLYKEYQIYKEVGNKRKARALIEKMVQKQPENIDFIDELCLYRMEDATDMMISLDYAGAIKELTYVAQYASDREMKRNALNKKYTCLFELRRYAQAGALLDTIRTQYENANFLARKMQLLVEQKRPLEALNLLEKMLNDSISSENRPFYLNDYEEIALPYIKEKLSNGATYDAYACCERLLKYFPASYYGLNYALTCASLLHKTADYDNFAKMALGYYPDDLKFSIRTTDGLARNGQFDMALQRLDGWFATYPNDSSLIKAYSGHSQRYAAQLLKAHEADSALVILNRALLHDTGNRELLYAKGLVFEKLHQYDSAHHYLGYYQPSLLEYEDFKVHLGKLEHRACRNSLTLEYLQARFGEQDVITSVATASYSRKTKRNTYTATLNYAGRDGSTSGVETDTYSTGGFGLQGVAQWEHAFGNSWSTTATLGLGAKYFPRFIGQIGIGKQLKNGWEAEGHMGVRRVASASRIYRWVSTAIEPAWVFSSWKVKRTSMFTFGGSVIKTLEQYQLKLNADILLYNGKLNFSTQGRISYYPMETRFLNFWATAGIGNAPEASVLDSALPHVFNKPNTNLGLGTNYMLTPHITVAAGGMWNTFSTSINRTIGTKESPQTVISTKYKNLFTINASLLLSF